MAYNEWKGFIGSPFLQITPIAIVVDEFSSPIAIRYAFSSIPKRDMYAESNGIRMLNPSIRDCICTGHNPELEPVVYTADLGIFHLTEILSLDLYSSPFGSYAKGDKYIHLKGACTTTMFSPLFEDTMLPIMCDDTPMNNTYANINGLLYIPTRQPQLVRDVDAYKNERFFHINTFHLSLDMCEAPDAEGNVLLAMLDCKPMKPLVPINSMGITCAGVEANKPIVKNLHKIGISQDIDVGIHAAFNVPVVSAEHTSKEPVTYIVNPGHFGVILTGYCFSGSTLMINYPIPFVDLYLLGSSFKGISPNTLRDQSFFANSYRTNDIKADPDLRINCVYATITYSGLSPNVVDIRCLGPHTCTFVACNIHTFRYTTRYTHAFSTEIFTSKEFSHMQISKSRIDELELDLSWMADNMDPIVISLYHCDIGVIRILGTSNKSVRIVGNIDTRVGKIEGIVDCLYLYTDFSNCRGDVLHTPAIFGADYSNLKVNRVFINGLGIVASYLEQAFFKRINKYTRFSIKRINPARANELIYFRTRGKSMLSILDWMNKNTSTKNTLITVSYNDTEVHTQWFKPLASAPTCICPIDAAYRKDRMKYVCHISGTANELVIDDCADLNVLDLTYAHIQTLKLLNVDWLQIRLRPNDPIKIEYANLQTDSGNTGTVTIKHEPWDGCIDNAEPYQPTAIDNNSLRNEIAGRLPNGAFKYVCPLYTHIAISGKAYLPLYKGQDDE